MNSTFLKDDLLGLRSKLENIEKEFEVKLKDVEAKESKFKKIDEQIDEFIKSSSKDNLVKLNIGGKVFQTRTSTLLGVKDTLFYKLICTQMDYNKEIGNEIFVDRSYKFFPFILDYIRTKKFSLSGYNKFDLEDIQAECEYYGISEVINIVADLQKEIEFVRFEGAPQYSTAGTHRLEDLKDKSAMKGICVQTPYHIIIELNYEHEIDSMDIAGWAGNSSLWYVGNGGNSKVSTSTDNSTWNEVGAIPSTYNATITNVKLRRSTAKFIKFQNTSYLGIGYLNLNRAKD